MNKVNKNFTNIENITNKFNNTKTYISKSNTKLKETKKLKQNKSNKILNRNNVSLNYFNKKTFNNENSLINNKLKKNKTYLINIKNSFSNKSLSVKGDLIPINKKEINNKKDNNIIDDYNNVKRKEVKYCKTEKKYNKKINNYNYYNSNQHVQNYNFNYNLRDKQKEEVKNDIKNNYNKNNIIITKKEIKPNNIIIETRKQNKDKNKVINYHSTKKNHNFYECKTINPNQLKIKSNNNNHLFESKMKENDEIKKNLNIKFNNTNKINTLNALNKINKEPLIHHYSSKNNSNIIKNSNKYNNIKVYSSISNKNVNSLSSNQNKNKAEKNIEKKIDNLKKKLLIKKKSYSYSPNKKISRNYFIYGKDKNIILDMDLITININQKLNYSHSEKIIKKIMKEKNDIIKNNNKLTRYLTEKNIMKIPFNNNNVNKKIITKNKSFDSIMPPNDFNELYKKSCKYFKLLNKV